MRTIAKACFVVAALWPALVASVSVLGEEAGQAPSAPTSQDEHAKLVYDLLVKEYRAGRTGLERLELLHNWSLRILQAEIGDTRASGVNRVEIAEAALEDHVSRMRELERQVAALALAGRRRNARSARR